MNEKIADLEAALKLALKLKIPDEHIRQFEIRLKAELAKVDKVFDSIDTPHASWEAMPAKYRGKGNNLAFAIGCLANDYAAATAENVSLTKQLDEQEQASNELIVRYQGNMDEQKLIIKDLEGRLGTYFVRGKVGVDDWSNWSTHTANDTILRGPDKAPILRGTSNERAVDPANIEGRVHALETQMRMICNKLEPKG